MLSHIPSVRQAKANPHLREPGSQSLLAGLLALETTLSLVASEAHELENVAGAILHHISIATMVRCERLSLTYLHHVSVAI